MNIIEIQNLSKYYRRSRGIEDITLNVRQGDIFGFIGPNGAGKSTTIRILLNLIFPTSGTARIFGMDAVRDSRAIRGRIGFVPSDANLYDRMKVTEFLHYSAAFYTRDDRSDRINELAKILELDIERKIHELSSGNKKKVSIIQSLIHHPELLILDEPTVGLDPLIQSRFFNLLREENGSGTTIFFSSHVLSEVQALCKTVGIVRNGKIIKVEEIATLRKKQLKKITAVFPEETDLKSLGIRGIESAELTSGRTLIFLFSGDINDLIGIISGMQIENLIIEEPPLEEIFLHFYADHKEQ